jgi:phytoene synthase
MPHRDTRSCASVVRRHARTFWWASRLLPAGKRRGAYGLYAFCRTADDIVDRIRPGGDGARAASELAAFRAATARALAGGGADSAVLRELAWTVATFHVPRAAIEELLDGVAHDLSGTRYATWPELEAYCEGVASSVGEMCAAVFGVSGGPAERAEATRCARTLGVAMQLTNVLRDVGEDAGRGRCYLPDDELARFGFSRDDVLSRAALRRREAWTAFMRRQVARARTLYDASTPGIALLSEDARPCAAACASGYARILDAIEHARYDTFTRRAYVGWSDRLAVVLRAWRSRPPSVPAPPAPPRPTGATLRA